MFQSNQKTRVIVDRPLRPAAAPCAGDNAGQSASR